MPSPHRDLPTSQPRILCHVIHHHGPSSEFVGGSTRSDAAERRAAVEATLTALRSLPYDVDVRVCGIPGAGLVPIDLDLSGVTDPRHLVYAGIEALVGEIDRYDHFMCIEDDVLVDADTVERMIRFQDAQRVNEVLLPNRLELGHDGDAFCVDLVATPGWRGLRRTHAGQRLDVAQNPHSGIAFLSRAQLNYARRRVDLGRRDQFLGGFMASAFANLHAPFLLWRTRDDESAHHVVHLDRWTSMPRELSLPTPGAGAWPAGLTGSIDEVRFTGVVCRVRGWAIGARPRAAELDGVAVEGVHVRSERRPDVVAAHPGADEDCGFELTFSFLELGETATVAQRLDLLLGDLPVPVTWPRQLASRAIEAVPEIPDEPFMSAAAVHRVEELLTTARCYLEYGTGGTTVVAARRGVPRMYCIESDPSWLAAVARKIEDAPRRDHYALVHADIGVTGDWGFPVGYQLGTHWSDYALAVWDRILADGSSPDLVLVDGRFRVACFAATVAHAAPGTRILFDDYGVRDYYHVAAEVLDPSALHGTTAEFVVPPDVSRDRAWQLLARHVVDAR